MNPNRKKAGRTGRFSLTDERIEIIAEGVRRGMPPYRAAALVGIPTSTAFAYIAAANKIRDAITSNGSIRLSDVDKMHLKLIDAIDLAEAEMMRRCLGIIDKAAIDGNWQAAAWKLERRWPEHFARTTRVDIAGKTTTEAPDIDAIVREMISSQEIVGPGNPEYKSRAKQTTRRGDNGSDAEPASA